MNRISLLISAWVASSFVIIATLFGGGAVCASDDEDLVQLAFAEKWGVQIHRRTTSWTTKRANPVMWVVRSTVASANHRGESLNALDIIARVNGVPATTSSMLKAVTESKTKPVRLTVIASTPLHENFGDPDEWLVAKDSVGGMYRTILLEGAAVGRDQRPQVINGTEAGGPIIAPVDLSPYKLLSLTDFVDEPEEYVDQGHRGFVRMPLWIGLNGITRMRDSDSAGQELIDGYGCFAADGERPGSNAEYVGNVSDKLNRGKRKVNIIFANRDMGRSLKDSMPAGTVLRFESLVTPWVIDDRGEVIYGVSIHYLEAKGAPVFDKATMSLIPAKPIVFRADVFEKRAALRRQAEEAGSR